MNRHFDYVLQRRQSFGDDMVASAGSLEYALCDCRLGKIMTSYANSDVFLQGVLFSSMSSLVAAWRPGVHCPHVAQCGAGVADASIDHLR